MCMTVPKIACSRLKLTLHLLEGDDAPEHIGNIHDEGQRLADFEISQINEIITSPDWFRFCFVRNPYHRLISAYTTQVGNTWNEQYGWLKQEIKAAFGYPEVMENQVPFVVSFRDFVHYLCDTREDTRRDGHFNIQTRILRPDLIQYDFVGRFENFQVDLTCILEQLKAPPEVIATASEVINPTYRVQLPLVFDKDLADIVYKMYELDFENYGYDRNSWMAVV